MKILNDILDCAIAFVVGMLTVALVNGAIFNLGASKTILVIVPIIATVGLSVIVAYHVGKRKAQDEAEQAYNDGFRHGVLHASIPDGCGENGGDRDERNS